MINQYKRIVKGKNFCPNPLAKFGIPKYADSRLNPKVVGTVDHQKFWEEQLYYITNGYRTGGIDIPGRYYYFLNFRTFETVRGNVFPDVVDLHLELAYLIDDCKKNHDNLIMPKGRRKGISEASHTMIVDYGWRLDETYNAGITSGNDIYVQDFINKWTFADINIVPELKKGHRYNEKEKAHISGYWEKDEFGGWEFKGINNAIYARTAFQNPNIFKGLFLNDAIIEEMGETENCEDIITATKQCIMFGSQQFGNMWGYGTGGNMNKGSKQFSNFWHTCESFGWRRFFIPATRFYFPFYGGCAEETLPNHQDLKSFERVGVEDEKAAREFILKERERLLKSGDMKKFREYMRETPLDIKEVFQNTVSNNFDVEKLNSQAYEIQANHAKYSRYKLSWVRDKKGMIERPYRVEAKLAPDDDDEEVIYILDDGKPDFSIKKLYCAGVDSYDQDQSRTSKSLGAMIVLQRDFNGKKFFKKRPVAMIRCRPKRKEKFYEMCMMLSVYYNLIGTTLVDVRAGLVMTKYKDLGLGKYLAKRPTKFESEKSEQVHEFGVSLNSFSRPRMVALMQSFVVDHAQDIWFLKLIDELLNYDEFAEDSDNDAGDALGIALMQDVSMDIAPREVDEEDDEYVYGLGEYEIGHDGKRVIVPSDYKQPSNPEQDHPLFGHM